MIIDVKNNVTPPIPSYKTDPRRVKANIDAGLYLAVIFLVIVQIKSLPMLSPAPIVCFAHKRAA